MSQPESKCKTCQGTGILCDEGAGWVCQPVKCPDCMPTGPMDLWGLAPESECAEAGKTLEEASDNWDRAGFHEVADTLRKAIQSKP